MALDQLFMPGGDFADPYSAYANCATGHCGHVKDGAKIRCYSKTKLWCGGTLKRS
jgi:hypothetical protein